MIRQYQSVNEIKSKKLAGREHYLTTVGVYYVQMLFYILKSSLQRYMLYLIFQHKCLKK